MNITIDKEFKTLIPPLSAEEFEQLEANCVENGIQDSLKVWNGILIDGHNRYEIAEKHRLEYKTEEMEFSSRDDVKLWIIKNQLGRRNLSAYDRSVLALKMKPLIADAAKARMILAPQKSAEREKKIKEIWDSFDYDVARNLVAEERKNFAKEDRRESTAEEKYIYFARFDGDKLKIGSSYDPEARVKQLSVSCPGIKIVEVVHFGKGSEKHERAIGKKFSKYKIGNECYQCSDDVLGEMIAFTKKERTRKDSTAEIISQVAGVSHDTIHKVEVIENSGDKELIGKVRNKETSINKAYREIRGLPPKQMPQTKVIDMNVETPVDYKPIEAIPINVGVTCESDEEVKDVAKDVADTAALAYASEITSGMSKIINTVKYNRADVVGEISKLNSDAFKKEEFKSTLNECIKVLVRLNNSLSGF